MFLPLAASFYEKVRELEPAFLKGGEGFGGKMIGSGFAASSFY